MSDERHINAAGLALIKKFEGLRLNSYLDSVGVPTVGYGHTGPEVKLGQKITGHQAEVILQSDVERFEEGVSDATRLITLSDNEFSALVSFAFNLGLQALRNSTLLRKLLAGDKDGAAEEFLRWTKAGGKVLPGLVDRRAAESQLFLAP